MKALRRESTPRLDPGVPRAGACDASAAGSTKGEDVGADTGIVEGDLERLPADRRAEADQLVHPRRRHDP